MSKRNPTAETRRIKRQSTAAPKTGRRRPAIAAEAAAEIAASTPPPELGPPQEADAFVADAVEAAAPAALEAELAAEIAAAKDRPLPLPPPPLRVVPPRPMTAPPPVVIIEPRVKAAEDEPTTRVIFAPRHPIHAAAMLRPPGWLYMRTLVDRLRSEFMTRSAPARARIAQQFPRIAVWSRLVARAWR